MQSKTPYVHYYTDALEAMPLLARGSNAVVFDTIGLLLPTHPDGPQIEDIVKVTALSVRTIQAALTLLIGGGLVIETKDGNFTPVRYIEYRSITHNVRTSVDQSINRQSNRPNQSSSSKLFTEEEFSKAYRALDTLLILRGNGMRPVDAEMFKELWDEYPDPALHARAIEITERRADRPNYRYYARVVETGAMDYDAKDKGKPVIEVQL